VLEDVTPWYAPCLTGWLLCKELPVMDWSPITPPCLLIVDDPGEGEDDRLYIPVRWMDPIDGETHVDGTVRDAFRELRVLDDLSARALLGERAFLFALEAALALEGPIFAAPNHGIGVGPPRA
jgi:hypothetical protein